MRGHGHLRRLRRGLVHHPGHRDVPAGRARGRVLPGDRQSPGRPGRTLAARPGELAAPLPVRPLRRLPGHRGQGPGIPRGRRRHRLLRRLARAAAAGGAGEPAGLVRRPSGQPGPAARTVAARQPRGRRDAPGADVGRRDVRPVGPRPAYRRAGRRALRDRDAGPRPFRLPPGGLARPEPSPARVRRRGRLPAREVPAARRAGPVPSRAGVAAPLLPPVGRGVPEHLGGPRPQLLHRMVRGRLGPGARAVTLPRTAGRGGGRAAGAGARAGRASAERLRRRLLPGRRGARLPARGGLAARTRSCSWTRAGAAAAGRVARRGDRGGPPGLPAPAHSRRTGAGRPCT